ncbi:hypothetical protein BDR06DRAFT_416334 [Suillus hirtellus]|nr:hypothetical protein BDR06DRAFT_416334 [Suillus hirtellus]
MPRPRIHCSESHPPTISDIETVRLFLRPNICAVTKRTNYKLKMVSLKKMKIIDHQVYNGFGVDSAATQECEFGDAELTFVYGRLLQCRTVRRFMIHRRAQNTMLYSCKPAAHVERHVKRESTYYVAVRYSYIRMPTHPLARSIQHQHTQQDPGYGEGDRGAT